MPILHNRAYWLKQPPGPIRINWKHPLTHYLGFAWQSNGLVQEYGLRNMTASSFNSYELSDRGLYINRVADAGIGFGNLFQSLGEPPLAILVVAAPADSAVVSCAFSQYRSAGGGTGISFLFNSNMSASARTGRIALFLTDSGNTTCGVEADPAGFDGEDHTWFIGRGTSSNVFVDKDGISNSAAITGGALSGTFTHSAQTTRIGNFADTAAGSDFCNDIFTKLIYTFNYYPGEDARLALGENPWQLWEPDLHTIYSFPEGAVAPGYVSRMWHVFH